MIFLEKLKLVALIYKLESLKKSNFNNKKFLSSGKFRLETRTDRNRIFLKSTVTHRTGTGTGDPVHP